MQNSLKHTFNYLFENDQSLTDDQPKKQTQKLSSLFKKSYPSFVPALETLTMDDKFMNALKGDEDTEDKLVVSTKTVKCCDLIPLQNEIDVVKTLDYFLKDNIERKDIIKICSDKVYNPKELSKKDQPIVISGEKYIIDGHHQWASIFILNPEASIQVKDIGEYKNPNDALKLSHIIIAALNSEKKKSKATPQINKNLLKLSKEEIKSHVQKMICDEFVYNYIHANIDEDGENLGEGFKNKTQVIERIVNNCLQLQKIDVYQNERSMMPQLDDGNYLADAQQGKVNLSDIKDTMNEHKKQLNHWKRLAGIL